MPGKSTVRPAACEMDRIIGDVAALEELADPVLGVIVDPDQCTRAFAKARVIEKREEMKPEFPGSVSEQASEIRQAGAGSRRLGKAVAKPPHCANRMPRIERKSARRTSVSMR